MKRLILILCLIITLTGCRGMAQQTESEMMSELAEIDTPIKLDLTGSTEKVGFSAARILYLYIGDSNYYRIHYPIDCEYLTDCSKYIYERDGSISVTVLSGVDIFNFSKSTVISNAEAISPNLLITKGASEEKSVLEAACLIAEDKAIVVRTVDNFAAFQTILEGLEAETVTKSEFGALVVKEDSTYVDIPAYDKATATVSMGLGDERQKVYDLGDSDCLTISTELRRFKDAIELYEPKIAIMSGTNVADVYYSSNKVYYTEVGNYVLGIYNENFNTVKTCFGYGDLAKVNTRAFLASQR